MILASSGDHGINVIIEFTSFVRATNYFGAFRIPIFWQDTSLELHDNSFSIDVDFHQHGNFPVLFFFGSADVYNQRKIYFLCIDFGAFF